jgi:DNA polymerase (family 10)
LYFTGSKNFNLYLRNKALENNYTLNEYSLTELTTNKAYLLKSEEEIFDILKIPYLTPKERNS